MKTVLCISSFIIFFAIHSVAQEKAKNKIIPPSGTRNAASFGGKISLGNFSVTHTAGIGLEYSRSNRRFGKMDKKPSKPFGFICNAGIAYYFGKEERIVTTSYKYPGYTYLHVYGGAIYNAFQQGSISFSAGPALGFYNGHTAFNIGAQLDGSFYINEQVAITPGILLMKENGSDPLWAGSLKVSLIF